MNRLLVFIVILAVAAVHAKPGGYTLQGGVFKSILNKNPDYMHAAQVAGMSQSCSYFRHYFVGINDTVLPILAYVENIQNAICCWKWKNKTFYS